MRIKNKYLRNRHFRKKYWKTARNLAHPYETYMPWVYGGEIHSPHEEQVKRNFEDITKQARALESGAHKQWLWMHSSADFRRILNQQRKAQERNAMAKIRNGDYEADMPIFKRDADWNYF